MNKNVFLGLGFVTLFGFSFLGLLLNNIFLNDHWHDIFEGGLNFFLQAAIGLVYGFATAYLGWLLINSKWLNQSLDKYSKLIADLELNIHEIIFISFCAGFGEEVLFRGSIQQFWGIWITAVFFVAIHGYLNPKDWRLFMYGLYMTLVIAGIGYAFEFVGLWSCIFAHFAIDLLLLKKLDDHGQIVKQKQQEKEESHLDDFSSSI